jgi:hypothetical protein
LLPDHGEYDLASCNLERHLYFLLSFVFPFFELELLLHAYEACMHTYPVPSAVLPQRGLFTSFLPCLCYCYCDFPLMFLDAFPLLPSWYYPLGVCILLILCRAYEFLSVLYIALLSVGVAL